MGHIERRKRASGYFGIARRWRIGLAGLDWIKLGWERAGWLTRYWITFAYRPFTRLLPWGRYMIWIALLEFLSTKITVPCDNSVMMLSSHFQNVFFNSLGRLCWKLMTWYILTLLFTVTQCWLCQAVCSCLVSESLTVILIDKSQSEKWCKSDIPHLKAWIPLHFAFQFPIWICMRHQHCKSTKLLLLPSPK